MRSHSYLQQKTRPRSESDGPIQTTPSKETHLNIQCSSYYNKTADLNVVMVLTEAVKKYCRKTKT